jgi:arsenate reductase
MAEGFARDLKKDIIEAYSAAVTSKDLDKRAVKVMAEAGIDISGQRSKHSDTLRNIKFDYVVTVCDEAYEICPVFPGKTKIIHVNFADPPRLAQNAKTEDEALNYYRRVRDEIREFIRGLPENLKTKTEKI